MAAHVRNNLSNVLALCDIFPGERATVMRGTFDTASEEHGGLVFYQFDTVPKREWTKGVSAQIHVNFKPLIAAVRHDRKMGKASEARSNHCCRSWEKSIPLEGL